MAAAAGSAVVTFKSIGMAAMSGSSVDRRVATFRHCSLVSGGAGSAQLRDSIGLHCRSRSSFTSPGINFLFEVSGFYFYVLLYVVDAGVCILNADVSYSMVEFVPVRGY